ncbi:MAG TPA: DNA repair protein RecN [Chloroflexota bacterium]|nr:DNA repair protein RecN [Chloroflexota bacterium]
MFGSNRDCARGSMLTHLTIENFAIIDRVDLDLGPGLVVLTGETGAGKSIVVDAVGTLLGNRIGPDVIRDGATQARVEGIFDLPVVDEIRDVLGEIGVEDEDGGLIVAREVNRSGRSVARINGRAVPLSVLQRLGQYLMDLHGQGDHLALLRPTEHLRLLDGFARLTAKRDEVRRAYQDLTRLRSEIAAYQQDQREIARRLDLLRYQVSEIDVAAITVGEDDALRQERSVLANSEKLSRGIEDVRAALSEGDRGSVLESLSRAATVLAELARIDPFLSNDARATDEAVEQVTEINRRLRRYSENIDFNPTRLEDIEERLEQIRNLQRKYGNSIFDVLAFADRARQELDRIEHSEERVAELQSEEKASHQHYVTLATDLSKRRREASTELAAALESELAALNMAGTRFAVGLDYETDSTGVELPDGRYVDFGPTGIDRCEFLIAPNAGEDLKPLIRIVSGGESARLMLALKTVLSADDLVPTLIFDEIDAGVGGQTAVVVGRKIANLARLRQIVCVTHLPQLAAFADFHFAVRKRAQSGRTVTGVRLLDREERVAELAGMFGGDTGQQTAQAHARETLEGSNAWKATPQLTERGTR